MPLIYLKLKLYVQRNFKIHHSIIHYVRYSICPYVVRTFLKFVTNYNSIIYVVSWCLIIIKLSYTIYIYLDGWNVPISKVSFVHEILQIEDSLRVITG